MSCLEKGSTASSKGRVYPDADKSIFIFTSSVPNILRTRCKEDNLSVLQSTIPSDTDVDGHEARKPPCSGGSTGTDD